jgi:hypothetical protein
MLFLLFGVSITAERQMEGAAVILALSIYKLLPLLLPLFFQN